MENQILNQSSSYSLFFVPFCSKSFNFYSFSLTASSIETGFGSAGSAEKKSVSLDAWGVTSVFFSFNTSNESGSSSIIPAFSRTLLSFLVSLVSFLSSDSSFFFSLSSDSSFFLSLSSDSSFFLSLSSDSSFFFSFSVSSFFFSVNYVWSFDFESLFSFDSPSSSTLTSLGKTLWSASSFSSSFFFRSAFYFSIFMSSFTLFGFSSSYFASDFSELPSSPSFFSAKLSFLDLSAVGTSFYGSFSFSSGIVCNILPSAPLGGIKPILFCFISNIE